MKLLSSLRRRRNQSSLEIEGSDYSRDRDEAAEERRRERERRMERPPDDDVCPICFGNFVFPCRGLCGHWYCGGCIIMYWNYGSALQPCKCPMCSQKVTKLIPYTSMDGPEDGDTQERIKKYNDLFVGGMRGLFRIVVQSPLILVKRFFTAAMDPDNDFNIAHWMRCIAVAISNILEHALLIQFNKHLYISSTKDRLPCLVSWSVRLFLVGIWIYQYCILGVLYCSFFRDSLPTERRPTIMRRFELFAVLLCLVLRVVGYICRWRRRRQVRQLLG